MRPPDPFLDAVESFFTDYLQRTRGCSRCTLASYRDTLRLFFAYITRVRGVPLDRLRVTNLDADLIVDFLEYLEGERHNQVSTRNCRLAALHSFFAHLLRCHPEHGGRLARILALPPKRHPPAPPRYLDPPVVRSLLHAPDRLTPVGRRDYGLFLFLYNTGARVSEAIAVRRKDLLPGPAVQLHGKGGKERVCPLWPETAAVIKSLLPSISNASDDAIFRNHRGQALSRHGVYYIITERAASIHRTNPSFPVKVWPHLLRHSCAVALLQAGVDLTVIRDQLGHVSVATTGRYATSNLQLKKKALEAFWAAAGIAPTARERWHPSPSLAQFLHSI
jgi:site-specific recombinase XerD